MSLDWAALLAALGGGCTVVTRFARALGMPWYRARWRRSAGASMEVARASSDLESPLPDPPEASLPEPIAGLMERARRACAGISQIAADPAWERGQVPVKEHAASARAQLRALEERARRLAMLQALLPSLQSADAVPAHLHELAEVIRSHCDGLVTAAELFERAQASLARALLAAADGVPGRGAPEAALRDIGATLDSLAQVLELLGEEPASQTSPLLTASPAASAPRSRPT